VVQETWEKFWLPRVMRENGTIDMRKIKQFLYDYWDLAHSEGMAIPSFEEGDQ
jgi:hypothetical protein